MIKQILEKIHDKTRLLTKEDAEVIKSKYLEMMKYFVKRFNWQKSYEDGTLIIYGDYKDTNEHISLQFANGFTNGSSVFIRCNIKNEKIRKKFKLYMKNLFNLDINDSRVYYEDTEHIVYEIGIFK